MNRDKIIKIFEKYASHPGRYPSGSDQVCRYDWNKIADEILASQWISVEDELPEFGKHIWFYSGLYVESGRYLKEKHYQFDDIWEADNGAIYGRATHWMLKQPLPAPPED